MNYEAHIDNKMDQIAKTVDKLENTLQELNECDGRAKCFYEQRKALHEIHTILRRSDSIQELRDEQAADELRDGDVNRGEFTSINFAEPGYVSGGVSATIDEARNDILVTDEDRTQDKINSILTKLDSTMAQMDDSDDKVESYTEQRRAIYEIKKVLQQAGHYNGYVAEDFAADAAHV